jgi:four helix bundle protein
MFRFERLRVWHKAIELYDVVDDVAEELAGRDRLILADQLRRAALSVSSNIAEGSGRETVKDSQHFYTVAKGSAFEVAVSLLCVNDVGGSRRRTIGRSINAWKTSSRCSVV